MSLLRNIRHFGRSGGVAGVLLAMTAAAVAPVAAHAATTLPVPTSLGTSPAPVPGDACGATQPYGYVGATSISFAATVADPSISSVSVEFSVVADDGSGSYDVTAGGTGGDPIQLNLPSSDFHDSTSYSWRARATDGAGDFSDWSTGCHFVVDQTPPPNPGITSTDFPASGSGQTAPPIRTTGTFTFHANDAVPGDAVRFEYDLDSELYSVNPSVPPGGLTAGSGWVPVNSDGTGTLTVTPTSWSNWIDVRTVDRAGNRSQPVRYTFPLTSTGPDLRGDLNGDTHRDLVATGKDGKLYVLYGTGTGAVKPAVTYPDTSTDWYPGLIAQNGDLVAGDGFQDILRINQAGIMVTMKNNGLGDFGQEVGGGWYRNDGSNWSHVTQMTLLGSASAQSGAGALLTVENGQLLLWPTTRFGNTGDSTVLDAAFNHQTVIAPGDITGDGVPDLLVRDDRSGSLELAVAKADGTFGAPSTWKTVDHGLNAVHYRLLASVGDVNGDGIPDLYAVRAKGGLVLLPGQHNGSYGAPVGLATSGIDWSQVATLA
jgi:hypothetical protein